MHSITERAWITVVREEGKHLPCRIMEVSPTTSCVATQEPLMPGETVRLGSRDRRWIAEVRHCTLSEGHYSIGLELLDDRLGQLRSVALRELFDSVPGILPHTERKVAALTFSAAAITAAVALGVILSLSGGLIGRASAGQPTYVPASSPAHVVTPPQVPAPQSSRLAIRATGPSWVTACADGKKLFERLLQPGDATDIPFTESAIVRSGNAGGLEVIVSGQSLGVMGQPGAIRMLRATPQGYDYVPAVVGDACVPQ